jgi:hypothetical protein
MRRPAGSRWTGADIAIADAAEGTHLFQEPRANEHVTALAVVWCECWLTAMLTREARHAFQKS